MKYLHSRFILFLSILFFTGALLYFLNNDFWQDEIYTITHFIYVPFKIVFTDYHTTNNHILFSVLMKSYQGIFLPGNIDFILLHPFMLRVVPIFISLFNAVLFYRLALKYYGKATALTGLSFWVTTICLVDFGVQLRGYSLNILACTIQYFSFLHFLRKEIITWRNIVVLATIFLITLLIMPTNIYLFLSYILLCGLLLLIPSVGTLFIPIRVRRANIVKIVCGMAAGTITCSLYYEWLLLRQPPISYINEYRLFSFKNLREVLVVFHQFTANSIHIYLLLLIYAGIIVKKFLGKQHVISNAFLPAFLFFTPFIFFFIHGGIVIDRIFLCLIPVFVLFITLTVSDITEKLNYRYLIRTIMILNLGCMIFSFYELISVSINANRNSLHFQTLTRHYYLVNYNAKQSALLAKQLSSEKKLPLYLFDDFHGTGIDYYLREFHVSFETGNDSTDIKGNCLILSANKIKMAATLQQRKIPFNKMLGDSYQYNLFVCTPVVVN
jgi:hypothetical protein